MDKYTTQAILDAIKLDDKISEDEKKKEEAKVILPIETYAICDMMNDIQIKLARLGAL